MLSHDNLTWDAVAIGAYLDIIPGWEDVVSYLPLSHVAAQVSSCDYNPHVQGLMHCTYCLQIVDLYITITFGVTVHFAQPDALKVQFGKLFPQSFVFYSK